MKNKLGFTLIELLVYIGLILILSTIVVSFIPNLIKTNSFIQKKELVTDSIERALDTIIQEIRHADAIYSPTSIFDSNPGQLSLVTTRSLPDDEEISYVDFFIDSEHLYMKREGEEPQLLIPENVRITELIFNELSTSSTIESVRISLSATYVSPSVETRERSTSELSTTVSFRDY